MKQDANRRHHLLPPRPLHHRRRDPPSPHGERGTSDWVGIGLALVSVTLMPLFGRAKKRIGNRLQSHATTGEGTQNILCAYLSLAILAGLAANAILGLWWADPLVALIVATVALQTGTRTWRGQACTETC